MRRSTNGGMSAYAQIERSPRFTHDMKANLRLLAAAVGLAVLGLTGCETTVETEPAVSTTTTTQTTEVHRAAPTATTETRVIREY